LEGLNLGEAELTALKANESLLGLVTHLTEQKRTANAEAKKHREMIEKFQADQKAQQDDQLKKQGEFQKLYEEAQQQLSTKDQMIKMAMIKGELSRLAGMHGLAKAEYLKLLDDSGLDVDFETMSVKGADEAFKKFMEDNPNLFTNPKVANTDSSQPKTGDLKSDRLKFYNDLKAKKNKSQPEITRLFSMERQLKKDGLI
jgi:hypothetical protein